MSRFLQRFVWLFAVILFGTGIDFVVHHLREIWMVETEYYWGKIIFGTVWSYLGYLALRHVLGVRGWRALAFGVPAIVALFLQTKYFYQGRDLGFVVVFMFLHFLMFLPAAWIVFRKKAELFLGSSAGTEMPAPLHWARFFVLVIACEAAFALYFLNQYGWLR